MFLLGISYMNHGVLVVFHIDHNHVIALPKVCWGEDERGTMCYDRKKHALSVTVTTAMPTGIGEFSWYVSLLDQVGHSPARAVGSTTKYDSTTLMALSQEGNLC